MMALSASGVVLSVLLLLIINCRTNRHAYEQGLNQWQWAKVVDAGTEGRDGDGNVCFAYMRDRIAVAFPKIGVKVWLWIKGTNYSTQLPNICSRAFEGTWQPQRSILRQNVTSIKFVEDGEALLGGTKDGVL